MNGSTLTDLDELVATVRERETRRLIEEAIAAYRGGALRAAIVSTWTATVADLFAKLRELSAGGDAAAIGVISKLDKAIDNAAIADLQRIERDLLSTVTEDFGFLAPHEFEDIQRLQKDRHLCAHPALVTKEVLFRPTPELVRAHIVHAIRHVLSSEPVQGKAALERFFQDLLSPSFPMRKEDAVRFIKGKYLGKPKEALVRSLIQALAKVATGSEADFVGKETKAAMAFAAVGDCDPALFEQIAPEALRKLAQTLPNDRLLHLVRIAGLDQRVWNWLPEPQRLQVVQLVADASSEDLKAFDVFSATGIEELRPHITGRFNGLDRQSKISLLSESPIPGLKSEAIGLFAAAQGFRIAESLMESLIIAYAPHFDAQDISKVLEAIAENGQISHANGVPMLLETLFDSTVHLLTDTGKSWRSFVGIVGKGKKRADYYAFPGIRKRLIANNIMKR